MQISGPERTRLFVHGVRTPITAEVTRRRSDGLVVAQALPFLRLDTPVLDGDGVRARISSVTIAMDGDVPRLLLELARELEDASSVHARRDDTVPTFTPGVSSRRARTDSTVPYDFQCPAPKAEVVVRASAPPSLPWWSRFFQAMASLWLQVSRRAEAALPPG